MIHKLKIKNDAYEALSPLMISNMRFFNRGFKRDDIIVFVSCYDNDPNFPYESCSATVERVINLGSYTEELGVALCHLIVSPLSYNP